MAEQDNGTQAPASPPPPRQPIPDYRQLNSSVECMDRFARNFETSARRWELIVYPSLFAFIVLAAYGFFLIFHLTSDIAVMARNVSTLTDSMLEMVGDLDSVASNMNAIAINMNDMSRDMHMVANRMEIMSVDMDNISQKINVLEPMQASIDSMDKSTRAMSITTDRMRHSVRGMNRGINQSTAPMQVMNSFMPFW